MVIAFCNIYFEPVAICDQFSFILIIYIIRHISILIFKVTIVTLNVLLLYCVQR